MPNPILVRDIRTDQVTEYPSIRAAAKALYISNGGAQYRVNSRGQKVFAKKYQLKKKKDPEPWGKITPKKRKDDRRHRAVLVRNIETGAIIDYISIAECAKAFKVESYLLYNRLQWFDQTIFLKRYQLKYKDDVTDWSDPTEEQLKKARLNNKSRAVLVRDLITNKETEYSNPTICAKAIGLKVNCIHRKLVCNKQRVYLGRYQIKYKDLNVLWRTPDAQEVLFENTNWVR